MAPSSDPSQLKTLGAAYSSPQSNRTFEHTIASTPPNPSQEDVETKVAYLSELRKIVPVLQNDINVFLTQQMEDDKKAAEAQGRQLSEKEAKEEENYGEEVIEDDA